MTTNFYAGGALPYGHQSYTTRSADQSALESALRGNYFHLIAPRQVGKTSLLRRLNRHLNEQGWRCAYIDLSILADLNKDDWYREIGIEMAETLTPDYEPKLQNQIDMRRYLLKRVLNDSGIPQKVALFFDEVEGASKPRDQNGEPFSDTFFMMLRNLYIERDIYPGTLVVALAGAVVPNNLVSDPSISPFNVGEEVNINDFSRQEFEMLVDLIRLTGADINQETSDTMFHWTRGHPYLSQRLCLALEGIAKQQRNLEAGIVDEVVRNLFTHPADPVYIDKNIAHARRAVKSLPYEAGRFWQAIHAGDRILLEVAEHFYLDLHLTGTVAVNSIDGNNILRIRNPIYQQACRNLFGTTQRDPMTQQRLDDLTENIGQTQQLLKETEAELRTTDQPRQRAKLKNDIQELQEELRQYREEFDRLSGQGTR